MPPIMNHQPVTDDDRLEALLLPLFVPVAVFSLADGVADADVRHRERRQYAVQNLLVEQRLLHIARQSCIGVLKCLKTCVTSQCG